MIKPIYQNNQTEQWGSFWRKALVCNIVQTGEREGKHLMRTGAAWDTGRDREFVFNETTMKSVVHDEVCYNTSTGKGGMQWEFVKSTYLAPMFTTNMQQKQFTNKI